MMVVGICRLTLMVSESHSLKEKRTVVRSLKDRVRQKFNVAVAEVGGEDAWQQALLGFAVVANDRAFVESVVDKIVRFVEDEAEAKVVDDEKDFVVYGDEPLGDGAGGYAHWEPEQPGPPIERTAGRRGRPGIPVRGSRRAR